MDGARPTAMGPMPVVDVLDDHNLFNNGFIGLSEQSCKECRRRKARCNRALPTCDLCIKYRRHCLYEKHARTPLTRKHLTEVEARLEKAEMLLKQMRNLVPLHAPTVRQRRDAGGHDEKLAFDFSDLDADSETMGAVEGGRLAPHRHPDPSDHQRMLESPPLQDFEWSEKDAAESYSLSPEAGDEGISDDKTPLSDGMASLSVNEGESGYLGVASGAALLRLLEPQTPQTRRRVPVGSESVPSLTTAKSNGLMPQPNPNRHITGAMIDAFFRHYHVSYPVVHESTFRAQYGEVIARPNGACWTALAYMVAAIGAWISAPSAAATLDMALFAHARSIMGFHFLEVGNLSLLQALVLASNYQQKRDRPNSAYNYLGLSGRMAMGLGLHKEFQGWNIPPLKMEIRRRIWWCLCCFDVGASITFGRPDVWPYKGVEVALPMNVNDEDLTAVSTSYPAESDQMTPYTAVATQARFHVATHRCYEKVISKSLPAAEEMLRLDSSLIEPWRAGVPSCFAEGTPVAERYALPQAIMSWRLRNLRIIMYRPFVIRRALRRKPDADEASALAYEKCLADAKYTIETIEAFWEKHEHNRLAAWYGLYFLFQATLIPCICLRNDPSAAEAGDWRRQIGMTLKTMAAMSWLNASSSRCHQIISELCVRYLDAGGLHAEGSMASRPDALSQNTYQDGVHGGDVFADDARSTPWLESQLVVESPGTQINNVFNMMWPNVPPLEAADVFMGDEVGWMGMGFLRPESAENWDGAL